MGSGSKRRVQNLSGPRDTNRKPQQPIFANVFSEFSQIPARQLRSDRTRAIRGCPGYGECWSARHRSKLARLSATRFLDHCRCFARDPMIGAFVQAQPPPWLYSLVGPGSRSSRYHLLDTSCFSGLTKKSGLSSNSWFAGDGAVLHVSISSLEQLPAAKALPARAKFAAGLAGIARSRRRQGNSGSQPFTSQMSRSQRGPNRYNMQ